MITHRQALKNSMVQSLDLGLGKVFFFFFLSLTSMHYEVCSSSRGQRLLAQAQALILSDLP